MTYCPCKPGISITHCDDDNNRFVTLANFHGKKRVDFEELRSFECLPDEPEDCIIDLFEAEGMVDNIPITRQMVERVVAELQKGGVQ